MLVINKLNPEPMVSMPCLRFCIEYLTCLRLNVSIKLYWAISSTVGPFFKILFICLVIAFLRRCRAKHRGIITFGTPLKKKKFLLLLDEYMACSGGKHPPKAILELWAAQFNVEFGGLPTHEMTLYQKKERMKKIYRGWKALQRQTGLGYDPSTDRVICSDEAW